MCIRDRGIVLAFDAVLEIFKVIIFAKPVDVHHSLGGMLAERRHHNVHSIRRVTVDHSGYAVSIGNIDGYDFGIRIVFVQRFDGFVLSEFTPVCMRPNAYFTIAYPALPLGLIAVYGPVRLDQTIVIELVAPAIALFYACLLYTSA